MRVERYLNDLGARVIEATFSEAGDALVRATADQRFGDYQMNGALALGMRLKRAPRVLSSDVNSSVVE
jgi:hypothetical protein